MKTTKLPMLLALLLTPALALANTVAIDWSGQITAYGSAGSGFPQDPLSDTNVSGVINLNLDLLPTPDQGNPDGVVSFTGTDFLQSSTQWAGGSFQPHPAGADGSDNLYLDLLGGQCSITDSSVYVDDQGVTHLALVSLSLTGLPQFTPGQGFSFGSDVTGSGVFGDSTADGEQGFIGEFQLDNIKLTTVSAPAPDSAVLSLGMLLALMVALIRVRRQPI
jgi:hypothetical protein